MLMQVLSLPVVWYVASETLSNIYYFGVVHVRRRRSKNPAHCIGTPIYYFLQAGVPRTRMPDKTDLIRNNSLLVER